MNSAILMVINSLGDLANSVRSGYADDRTLNEIWGWNQPALSRHDLADLAGSLSSKLQANNIEDVDATLGTQLAKIPERINLFKTNVLPYLYNGNGVQAAPIYFSLIEWISAILEPLFNWQILNDNKALPPQLVRRLRGIESEINEITPRKEELQSQIKLIKNATEAAETLPTDLESLKEAREKVGRFSSESTELHAKIEACHKKIEGLSEKILEKKIEADKLVSQCEEAYRITTTKGLAAAFDQRAKRLSISLIFWIVGLLGALGAGIYIGNHRFEVLNTAMSGQKPASYIWIQIFLSILSFGAPIWLAWIATKQISQRFKLSEDYAFKASVAKAYEGYRKEAARIDEDLEARLFDSALTRLEEPPLRLLESEHHGSPWHELITSKEFKEAMDKVPTLKDALVSIYNKGRKTKSNGVQQGDG